MEEKDNQQDQQTGLPQSSFNPNETTETTEINESTSQANIEEPAPSQVVEEQPKQTEQTEQAEQAEQTEQTEQVEQAEQVEQPQIQLPVKDPLTSLTDLARIKQIFEREDNLNNIFLKEFHNLLAHKAQADMQYSLDVGYIGNKIEKLSNQIKNEDLQDQLHAISTNFSLVSRNTKIMSQSLRDDIQSNYVLRMEKSGQLQNENYKEIDSMISTFNKQKNQFVAARKRLALFKSKATPDQLGQMQGSINQCLADLNSQVNNFNEQLERIYSLHEDRLASDLSMLSDSVLKYFIFQTSFIKNTEYDANKIVESLDQVQIKSINPLKKVFLKEISRQHNDMFQETSQFMKENTNFESKMKLKFMSMMSFMDDVKDSFKQQMNQDQLILQQEKDEILAESSVNSFDEFKLEILKVLQGEQSISNQFARKVFTCYSNASLKKAFNDYLLDFCNQNNGEDQLLKRNSFMNLKELLIIVFNLQWKNQELQDAVDLLFASQDIQMQRVVQNIFKNNSQIEDDNAKPEPVQKKEIIRGKRILSLITGINLFRDQQFLTLYLQKVEKDVSVPLEKHAKYLSIFHIVNQSQGERVTRELFQRAVPNEAEQYLEKFVNKKVPSQAQKQTMSQSLKL